MPGQGNSRNKESRRDAKVHSGQSATTWGPEPTVRLLAKDEPTGILRQLKHESNEISTERKRELEEERRRRGRG